MGMREQYVPDVVSPEGTVRRWRKIITYGSETPPPTMDECPPRGVGPLFKVKPGSSSEQALRERVEVGAGRSWGNIERGVPKEARE